MKLKSITLALGTLAAATIFSACGSSTGNVVNTNANVRNVNTSANSNVAVLVNNNSAMANSNRWSNTNVTREEYNKNRADYEKDRGESKIGSGANDSWLWFKTRAALMTADDLRESTISVDVENDVVTLNGTVANAAQKAAAEKTAKGIEGVKSVKNNLKISADDDDDAAGNTNHNANTKK